MSAEDDAALARRLRGLDPGAVADRIFGEERTPMQWHEDVVVDVVEALVSLLSDQVTGEPRILPLDPHALEDAGLVYNGEERRSDGVDAFRRQLLAVWVRAHEVAGVQQVKDFHEFSGHTKDLLLALGLEWDSVRDRYAFGAPARGAK